MHRKTSKDFVFSPSRTVHIFGIIADTSIALKINGSRPHDYAATQKAPCIRNAGTSVLRLLMKRVRR